MEGCRMSVKNSIQVVPLETFTSAALNPAVYQAVNTAGLPNPCFKIRISNLNTTVIIISFDGVTDHEIIGANQTVDLSGGFGASQPNNNSALWSKGTIMYVRGTAGVGLIAISGYYQSQGA